MSGTEGKFRVSWLALIVFGVMLLTSRAESQEAATEVENPSIGEVRNLHAVDDLLISGQPTEDDFEKLKAAGVERVVTLQPESETEWDQAQAAREAGLEFRRLPIAQPRDMSDELMQEARSLLKEADQTKTLLYCASANRAGAVWLAYRVLDQDVDLDTAVAESKELGLLSPRLRYSALRYIRRQQVNRRESVKPGINENFLSSDLEIDSWTERFEVESREVYAARDQVLRACGVELGMRIADVGAGTGLYTRLFADKVGADGWVYAVDISTTFLQHIRERCDDEGIANVSTVLGAEDAIGLPPESVDLVFVCDTYHHFEFPQTTVQSIKQSLRPGGRLVVIDFERIPGESREWTIDHVRAGKEVFQREIESQGLRFVGEKDVDGLEENYFLEFVKPAS